MRSTFFGLETQRRAILTQRRVMDTIGHNIANASTPGYSRQEVTLAATNAYPYPGVNRLYGAGQIGTGVISSEVRRIRDVFVDNQLRVGTGNTAELAIEKQTLRQIENAFLEPSTTTGINGALSDFFNAWQELSKRPEDYATRTQVLATGQNLTTVIQNIDQTLRRIRLDLNSQLQKDVAQVNEILHEIAALNPEIAKVYTHGDTPNDLLDKRDLLIDELSEYVNCDVMDSEYMGGLAISIGGRELIRNDHVYELNLEMDWDHPSQNSKTPYLNDVSQDDFTMLARFSSGELKGIIDSRDDILVGVQGQFTQLVQTLANSYNNLHSQGFGINTEDYSAVGSGTTASIQSNSNYAEISALDTQYFEIGEKLSITDPADPSNSIMVTVTDVQVDAASGQGRLYFDNLGPLMKVREETSGNATAVSFSIGAGAEIRKVTIEKFNFFETQERLPRNFTGDMQPDYFSQMTSSLRLPDHITLKSTLKDLENYYGIDISDSLNGSRLSLDENADTALIMDTMTLDEVFRRISGENLQDNDGKSLEIAFDEINRAVMLKGDTYNALDALGGADGSANNLFRILGFEGYNITGFALPDGTQLNAKLSDLGISEGWMQIDNTLIQIDDNSITLKAALDKINNALNVNNATNSYHTNMFFDGVSGNLKLVSNHVFSTATPDPSQYANLAGVPYTQSNFLTVSGLQREDTVPTYAKLQSLTSVTTSDMGARISVNEELLYDGNRIATGKNFAGIPGDNSIAIELAALKNAFLMGDTSGGNLETPSITMDSFYSNMVADVGVKSQTTIMNADAADSFLEYYQNRKQEVSGVSIDEEMVKLIEAQHSFAAASRMINVVDSMLDRIINGTGLVGR